MQTITTTVTVYDFDELTDDAKTRAIEVIRQRLNDGWDSADNDDIRDVITATLAEKLGTPGVQDYGVSDFPGIDTVTIDGFSLDRSQILAVSGYLTRDNAPKLPWRDGISQVILRSGFQDRSTRVEVELQEVDCTCPEDADALEHVDSCPVPKPVEGEDEIEQAVRDALSEAWLAGEKEGEYKTGEEYAREVADGHQFTEDGELYRDAGGSRSS